MIDGIRSAATGVCVLLVAACSTTGGRTQESAVPSKLTPDTSEIPPEVRAIEIQIDRTSVILADEITVEVSKNYQFEVSLTGDNVTRDLSRGGAHDRVATGKGVAFFRNLRMQCDRSLRVSISDFGTEPFIRIRAKGHCSHIMLGSGGETRRKVIRARGIAIDNAGVRYSNIAPAGSINRK